MKSCAQQARNHSSFTTLAGKSIEVGGLPFDMRPEARPAYEAATVIKAGSRYGASILPAEMGDEEDDLYASLVR